MFFYSSMLLFYWKSQTFYPPLVCLSFIFIVKWYTLEGRHWCSLYFTNVHSHFWHLQCSTNICISFWRVLMRYLYTLLNETTGIWYCHLKGLEKSLKTCLNYSMWWWYTIERAVLQYLHTASFLISLCITINVSTLSELTLSLPQTHFYIKLSKLYMLNFWLYTALTQVTV